MNMKKIVVVCAALAVGSTLTIQAQQTGWVPTEGQANVLPVVKAPNAEFLQFESRPIEAQLVKGMPYSAELTTERIQTLGDGNRIVQKSTGRVYRDAEGRVRREDDRPSSAPSISITDPVANKSYTLDAANRTARETPGFRFGSGTYTVNLSGYIDAFNGVTVTPRPTAKAAEVPATAAAGGRARGGGGGGGVAGAGAPTAAAGAGGGGRGGRVAGSQDPQSTGAAVAGGRGGSPQPAIAAGGGARGGRGGGAGRRDDRVEETLPNRSIEGVMCTGIRRTTTIAKDAIGNDLPIKIVSEEWTSVDLGVLVLTDTNDPRTARSTYKLTNINRRDPDPSLFKVPGDYTIQGGGGRGRGGDN